MAAVVEAAQAVATWCVTPTHSRVLPVAAVDPAAEVPIRSTTTWTTRMISACGRKKSKALEGIEEVLEAIDQKLGDIDQRFEGITLELEGLDQEREGEAKKEESTNDSDAHSPYKKDM